MSSQHKVTSYNIYYCHMYMRTCHRLLSVCNQSCFITQYRANTQSILTCGLVPLICCYPLEATTCTLRYHRTCIYDLSFCCLSHPLYYYSLANRYDTTIYKEISVCMKFHLSTFFQVLFSSLKPTNN